MMPATERAVSGLKTARPPVSAIAEPDKNSANGRAKPVSVQSWARSAKFPACLFRESRSLNII